jgi:uncharacterized membrane protein
MSILLIGALGLAIDGGQMYAHRQMAQAAADAAAQAGIMSIFDGNQWDIGASVRDRNSAHSLVRLHHGGRSNALRLCAK